MAEVKSQRPDGSVAQLSVLCRALETLKAGHLASLWTNRMWTLVGL